MNKNSTSTNRMKNQHDTTRLRKMGTKPRRYLSTVVEGRACPQSRTLPGFVPDRHAATQCDRVGETDRSPQSNGDGLGALVQSARTTELEVSTDGWTSPPFTPSQKDEMIQTVCASDPVNHALPGHGWTLKKLCRWVESRLGCRVSRSTLRQLLKVGGLSWKKCKKVLTRAKPAKRVEFVEQFQLLFERMCRDEICLVYVDESHFHQDLDLGYTWAPVGKPVWRESTSPPLAARINWYGAYDFSQGRALIWHE